MLLLIFVYILCQVFIHTNTFNMLFLLLAFSFTLIIGAINILFLNSCGLFRRILTLSVKRPPILTYTDHKMTTVLMILFIALGANLLLIAVSEWQQKLSVMQELKHRVFAWSVKIIITPLIPSMFTLHWDEKVV